MRLFTDCTTEIAIRDNAQPWLLSAYEKTKFLLPLRSGDYPAIRAAVLFSWSPFAPHCARGLATDAGPHRGQ
jgi:hypothetical protein